MYVHRPQAARTCTLYVILVTAQSLVFAKQRNTKGKQTYYGNYTTQNTETCYMYMYIKTQMNQKYTDVGMCEVH